MPASPDDLHLLQAWRSRRDEAAFRELCTRHAGLVAAACRRLGSPDADEAVQAVFLVLAQRADAVDIRVLAGWLTGTARKVVANQRLVAARRRRHEQEATVEHARQMSAAADPAWDEARGHLDEALASLSASRREAVVRFYLEGRPQGEIAAALGCSENAVRLRVHEGLERLRAFFARRGVVLGAAALASGLAAEAATAEPALVATCTKVACAPASAPTVAKLASGIATGGGLGTMAVVATTAAVLGVTGGIMAWPTAAPAPVPPPLASPPAPPPAPAPAPPPAAVVAPPDTGRLLVAEDFEDGRFAERGWYDNPQGFIRSATEHAPGSAHAAEFHFRPGAELPLSGEVSRRQFPPSDAIRIAYAIRYSPEWVTTAPADTVNQIMVLTTADNAWESPLSTHLTCAIGVHREMPFIDLHDPRNLDTSRVGQNLVGVTEARAVAGGNGDGDGHGAGYCYPGTEGRFWNGKRFAVADAPLSDLPGPRFKGLWHRIEVRLRLNRIVDGKAVADGHLSYAVDGQVVLDRPRVLFRTARQADARFNQLIVGPWCVGGAPQEQSFWIDDLTVHADVDPPVERR